MKFLILSLSLLFLLTNGSLVYVIEVFRHGIREPVYPYWNSQIVDADYGELTTPGARQQYILGAQMRKEYIETLKFLSPTFNHSEIYLESTNVNRTLASALSHYQGFYPVGTGPNLPENYPEERAVPPYRNVTIPKGLNKSALPFNFNTVPLHSKDRKVLNMDRAYVCPIMPFIQKEVNHSSLMKKLIRDFEPQIERFLDVMNISDAKKKGYPCNEIGIVQEIFDNFQVQKFNNRKHPYIEEDLWIDMLFLYNIGIQVEYFQTEFLKRFFNTLMFTDFLGQLDGKINGSNTLKWRTYSAHDSHISQLLSGLNLTSWQCIYEKWRKGERDHDPKCAVSFPTYGSSMIFELHKKDGASDNSTDWDDFYVKMKHQGQYKPLCKNENNECLYSEFRQRLSDYRLENFQEICQRKKIKNLELFETDSEKNTQVEESSINFGLTWVLFSVLEAIVLAILIYKFLRQDKRKVKGPQIDNEIYKALIV